MPAALASDLYARETKYSVGFHSIERYLERRIGSWVRDGGGFMAKYRLKAPVSAVLHTPGGQKESVMIPAGALIDDSALGNHLKTGHS